jgi:hypothetical protein
MGGSPLKTIERRKVMPLTEAQLRDDYQVWVEFIERHNLEQFQIPGQNHNQITKDGNFKEFDAPTDEWMKNARSRPRAGVITPDEYTIVFDNKEHEQQLRSGLSTPGRKKQSVKLHVGKILIGGGVENLQWPIGRVEF